MIAEALRRCTVNDKQIQDFRQRLVNVKVVGVYGTFGVECPPSLNDTTATALGYGITKIDLRKLEAPCKAAFVGVDHATLSNLGSRDISHALLQHFDNEFSTKNKLGVLLNPQAVLRLASGCEKLKEAPSATAEAGLNVSSISLPTPSQSVKSSRTPFIISLSSRRLVLTLDQIHSDAFVGGSIRVLAVKQNIQETFGGKTLLRPLPDVAFSPWSLLRPRSTPWKTASLRPGFVHRKEAFQVQGSYAEPEELPRSIDLWISNLTAKAGSRQPYSPATPLASRSERGSTSTMRIQLERLDSSALYLAQPVQGAGVSPKSLGTGWSCGSSAICLHLILSNGKPGISAGSQSEPSRPLQRA
ncbi:hypothetical protein NMY22_g3059 [Coprinellus aureogranulatus]|nr:hypothetical protein NMY22_g3059 [Coprinellus aureogranulatus]